MDNTTIDRRRREYEQMPIEALIDTVARLGEQAASAQVLARVAGEVLKGRAQDLINSLSV